jgi:hypothetical protein
MVPSFYQTVDTGIISLIKPAPDSHNHPSSSYFFAFLLSSPLFLLSFGCTYPCYTTLLLFLNPSPMFPEAISLQIVIWTLPLLFNYPLYTSYLRGFKSLKIYLHYREFHIISKRFLTSFGMTWSYY